MGSIPAEAKVIGLWCMRGFSGSGKSARAREIAAASGAVVVNRDLLRLQLLGSYWTGDKTDEDRVTIAEEAQVKALLKSGVSVVCDSTHLNPRYLRKWARVATRFGATFEVVDVHADIAECKKRVFERWERNAGSDLVRYLDPKVVDDQAKRFPVEKWPTITADPPFVVEPAKPNPALPKAIISDLDGTLFRMNGRSPYDYSRVGEDSIDPIIRGIVNRYHTDGYTVLLVSGRDDSCYPQTLCSLLANDVWYDKLLMRPVEAVDGHGGKLPDFQVKYDLFNEFIRDQFDVQFVLDDRRQVIDMWRALGLKVLDVAGNEF